MGKWNHYKETGKVSIIIRIMLVAWDIICINLCSFLALMLRYDMRFDVVSEAGIYDDYRLGYLGTIERMAIVNTILTIVVFALFKLYHSLWRFAGINEGLSCFFACIVSGAIHFLTVFGSFHKLPRTYFVIYTILLFLLTVAGRFSYRVARMIRRRRTHGAHMRNTMIIGAGEACNLIITELINSDKLDSDICAIIDDDKIKQGTYIHGVKVVGGRDEIIPTAEKYNINEIIIAMPSASRRDIGEILEICQETGAALKILPGIYQFVTGEAAVEKLRPVQIEDLLGREPVQIDIDAVTDYVRNKVVLVTGGGGSIGSELCRQIATKKPKLLIIFDIYENNAYDIQQELRVSNPELRLETLIGSVRNTSRMEDIFKKYKPQIVYHAAAHKHVPLMEDSPNEAIKNNVFGTYKTALAADKYGTERFVLISTDKAVNPTNIMGASKRICEMVIQELDKRSTTEFVAVRFGNVLGSNGSVIPLFKKQIEAGGPVTVTDKRVIRYFMTIPEAVSLVLEAGALAKGGEIFVLDMGKPVRIDDLARNLIKLSGYEPDEDIEIVYTGLRPGEKLYEEMLMDEEGLSDTEHEMIHIGKPIDFDGELFLEKLDNLYDAAYGETDRMKEIVAELVPTYNEREQDKERDRKRMDEKYLRGIEAKESRKKK
ncbi:MAG: polysaccharide biosynthesis protein [Eubacterium sp.]|nr:polysaccharide biosynthesis protein [Eubacterium sp.]